MSIWTDVTHNPVAAQEAIDELHRLATHLEALTEARTSLADQATRHWEGARRSEFDDALDRLVEHSGELIVRLRRAAVRIAEEGDAATMEQQRRERLRQRWEVGPARPG